jgi:hypothetical protein
LFRIEHVACTEYNSAISRRDAPEVFKNHSRRNKEGAGNAGCALHPRSRVQKCAKKAHTSIQVQRRHPTFPAQWLYDLYRALLGEPGFLATVTWRMIPQSLTPASGRQDHTTSSSASRAVRQKRIRGHRIPSRACDDRETPLVPRQDQIAILLIWPRGQVNFGKSEILSGRPIAAWFSIT